MLQALNAVSADELDRVYGQLVYGQLFYGQMVYGQLFFGLWPLAVSSSNLNPSLKAL
jgi:hypothetical protein